MDTASENEPRQQTHRLRILPWITGLFIAIALYVLSSGPVVRLVQSGKLPQDIGVIYMPLVFLDENFAICHRFFDWYLAFWRTL